MDVRQRYEAEQLERRRLALALRRGSAHDSLLRESHPERYVAGGLGVAFLVTVAAGIIGLVSPRAPKGWDDPGKLVLDEQTGQRYAVDASRTLRPVLNETSLRLVFPGGVPASVSVEDRFVRDARRGTPVGRTDVPFEPPVLLAADAPGSRCQVGDRTVVTVGTPAEGPTASALVRQGDAVSLLSEGRAHPVTDPTALGRLGYLPEQVVPVAPVVLEAVPTGPALTALTVPPGDPLLPPEQREGTLVTGEPSGRSAVVAGGVLRALPTRTAVQLVFGPAPPPAVVVPDAAVDTAPRGDPVVADGLPTTPPDVTPPAGALCVDQTGAVRVPAALPRVPEGPTALLTPSGSAVLLATSPEALERTSEQAPVLLVTDGRAFPITSSQTLSDLGYSTEQVQLVSPGYAALPPTAPALVALPVS